MMPAELLNLSIVAQIALGSGYLAYLLAYAGIRQHHNATDAIFKTLAFGLVATAVMTGLPLSQAIRAPLAIVATILVGGLWRWKGMSLVAAVLHKLDVHWSDDIPTAWLSVTALRTDCFVSQIAVDLIDGRTLVCEDTRRFQDAPFKSGVFGLNGDLALYVSAELRADGEWIEHTGVRNIDGDNLTYVPASAIKRVEIRHWTRRINGKGAAVVEQPEDAAAALADPSAEPNPECK